MGGESTSYSRDGDNLATEGPHDQTAHYLYEPVSFVPLVQMVSMKLALLHQQPVYAGGWDTTRVRLSGVLALM